MPPTGSWPPARHETLAMLTWSVGSRELCQPRTKADEKDGQESNPRLRVPAQVTGYVLEQSLRYGPLKTRRTAFSVTLAIFCPMRGEAQQPRTVVPGHKKNDSCLQDRPPTSKRFEPRR